MKNSSLLYSRLKPTFFIILITVFLSACTSETSARSANSKASDNGISNSTKTNGNKQNQAASISGQDKGSVTEDDDENNDDLLSTYGRLSISDTDEGEAAFRANNHNSSFGKLSIDSAGGWRYDAINSQPAIQNLNTNETLRDDITVNSVDGTSHTISVTINGKDEPTPIDPTPVNSAAVISGTDKGQVTEDTDNNGILSTSGQLTITDADPGEAAFVAGKINGKYGAIDISSSGSWTYSADNQQSVIQNLNTGQTLNDSMTVRSIDGTQHTISITILGTDEANSPALISGTDKGQVTEDTDNNGILSTSGQLTITDADPGEAAFVAGKINGKYGAIDISSSGSWTYSADNQQSVIQNLNTGQTLNDSMAVGSIDGTNHNISITIYGADEETVNGPIVAMYSYNADLSNAQTLSNASLEQTTVYMFFTNVSQYDSMTFNCCKGKSGDATGEAHSAPVQDTSAPFIYAVDLSQYTTSGTRVLKAVASNADTDDDLFVNFSINVTSTPTDPEPTPGPTSSADITFTWVAPSQREDDTAISLSEINGYTIHYGTSPGNYNNKISINDGSVVSHTITNLSAGTYYFSVTARDTDGNHSAYAPEVRIQI